MDKKQSDDELKNYLLETFRSIKPQAADVIIQQKIFNEALKHEIDSGDLLRNVTNKAQVADIAFNKYSKTRIGQDYNCLIFMVLQDCGYNIKPPYKE